MSLVHNSCPMCSPLFMEHGITVCVASECNFLCEHMYKCDTTCYDFNNGHICKHIHRVHSLVKTSDLNHSSVVEDTEVELSYAESVFNPKKGLHVATVN